MSRFHRFGNERFYANISRPERTVLSNYGGARANVKAGRYSFLVGKSSLDNISPMNTLKGRKDFGKCQSVPGRRSIFG